MNTKDPRRDDYVFSQRQLGRTYKSISDELGVTVERVRQIYARACRDRRERYFASHPGQREIWLRSTDPKVINFIPEE